jgi:hypothetical protein
MRITESTLRRIVRQEASRLHESPSGLPLPPEFDDYIMQCLKDCLVDDSVGFEDAIMRVRGRVNRLVDEFERWCFANDIPQVSSRRMS